jgi:hypothetical protein
VFHIKVLEYYILLHTWDSFLREKAAPRICESVVGEDLIYSKPHESVRLELEESLLVGSFRSRLTI